MEEAGFRTLLGIPSGTALFQLSLRAGQPVIEGRFGIFVPVGGPTTHAWLLLGAMLTAGLLVGSIPGDRA